MLKSVTVKIDDELLKKIDRYAESTYQTRTRAIIQMLESTQVNITTEGVEILKCLHRIESEFDYTNLLLFDRKNFKEVLDKIWQLLNSATQKLPRTIKTDEN